MKPDDRFSLRVDGWEIPEPLPQARYVFTAAQGVDGKSREKNYEAKRQQETVDEIHGFRVQTLVCILP